MSFNCGNFSYKILEHLATLEQHKDYTLEINRIDYGRGEPKYDLRRWRRKEGEEPEMLKGITFNAADFEALKNYFKESN